MCNTLTIIGAQLQGPAVQPFLFVRDCSGIKHRIRGSISITPLLRDAPKMTMHEYMLLSDIDESFKPKVEYIQTFGRITRITENDKFFNNPGAEEELVNHHMVDNNNDDPFF